MNISHENIEQGLIPSEAMPSVELGGLATRAAWQDDVARLYGRTREAYPVVRALDHLAQERVDLEGNWLELEKKLTNGVEAGIEQGYIPAVVSDRLPDALHRTGLELVERNNLNHDAHYDDTADRIVTSSPATHVLAHELMHKLAGGTFVWEERRLDTDTAANRIGRSRSGFAQSSHKDPEYMLNGYMNEAITEHLTQAVLYGEFDVIDPDMRTYKGVDPYHNRRKVLSAMIEKSQGLVSVDTMCRAYFEDTETGENISDRRAFVTQVLSAYGPGALRDLENLCALSEYRPSEVEATLSRIHAPELNSRGNIIKFGWLE